MVVDDDQSFVGNIGAGCHEAELIERAARLLHGGRAAVESVALEDELLDGSVCGASLDVVLWKPGAEFCAVADAIARGQETVTFDLEAVDAHGIERRYSLAFQAHFRLVLAGATHFAACLSEMARVAGFSVTVIDPRAPFASAARHPHADRLIVAWPDSVLAEHLDERSAFVTLAHDLKIDVPALRVALRSPAFYIGALGSRRAQRVRSARLREAGASEADIARVHGPTGLDLGAESMGETALSILADIVVARNGATGEPLSSLDGSIHSSLITTRGS